MTARTGLLLVNLGSPDAPTAKAVRRYLFQFLHDHRVIKLTRWIWCPILHFIILRVRPRRVAKAYASIWEKPDGALAGKMTDEAPLIRITRAQAAGLQERLGEGVIVETAMRYGNPSIESALAKLMEQDCERVAIMPAYPQFAGATVASIYDAVGEVIKKMTNVPELRFMRHYYDDPRYISALAESVKQHLSGLNWTPDAIIASYHGIPKQYVIDGDPYEHECHDTTRLLRDALGMDDTYLRHCFQSRFGPSEWLQPYLDKTLESIPAQGIKKLAVLAPTFAADCLETLEEIAVEGAEIFEEHGGTHYTMIPCLNDDTLHLDALAEIAKERLLSGWIKPLKA